MRRETKEVAVVSAGMKKPLAALKRRLKADGYEVDDGTARGAHAFGCYQWRLDVRKDTGLPWGDELNAMVNAEAARIWGTLLSAGLEARKSAEVFTGDGDVIVRLPFSAVGHLDTRTYLRR